MSAKSFESDRDVCVARMIKISVGTWKGRWDSSDRNNFEAEANVFSHEGKTNAARASSDENNA